MKKRDFGIPIGAAAVGLGVGVGVDAALSSIAADAAGAAAVHGAEAARVTAENSAAFVHGAEYGVLNQVSDVASAAALAGTHHATHQLAMHAADQVPWNDVMANQAAQLGAHAGHVAAQAAETDAVKVGVMKGFEVGVEKGLESRDKSITREQEEWHRRRLAEKKREEEAMEKEDSARSLAGRRAKGPIIGALDCGKEKEREKEDDSLLEGPIIRARAESISDLTSSAYWDHYYSQSRWKRWPKKIFCCYGCV